MHQRITDLDAGDVSLDDWESLGQMVIDIQRRLVTQVSNASADALRIRRQSDEFIIAVHAALTLCRRYTESTEPHPGFAKIARRLDAAFKRYGVEEVQPSTLEPGLVFVSDTQFMPDCPEGTILSVVCEALRQGNRIVREANVVSSRTLP